jgi:hypothetical protein
MEMIAVGWIGTADAVHRVGGSAAPAPSPPAAAPSAIASEYVSAGSDAGGLRRAGRGEDGLVVVLFVVEELGAAGGQVGP